MSISVGAAGKVGDGVNGYYVFKVTSEMFSVDPIQVDRRYSDFLWLHTQLAKQCAGYIIPPLPAKVVPLLQGPEFLERRRAGLEKFLRKVVEHDELKNTNYFKSFLECSPVELTAIKAEAQKQANANGSPTASTAAGSALGQMAQKSQQLNSWWGKAYQRMAENDKVKLLAAKAGRDLNSSNVIEDAEFDRIVKYVTELHALVKTMQSRAESAHKQNKLAAGAYCDLIECMSSIADIEESSLSGGSSDSSADKTALLLSSDFGAVLSLLDTRARLIDSELAEFAESVDYFARWVGAVMSAVNVREDRRFVYQAKLAAKSNNGNNNNTTSNYAPQDLVEAKEDFEKVHARVVREVDRFQSEKAVELRRMFVQYAALQTKSHGELGDVLAVSARALQQSDVASLPFATRFFSTSMSGAGASNQQEDELAEQKKIYKTENKSQQNQQQNQHQPRVGCETDDLYADVSL